MKSRRVALACLFAGLVTGGTALLEAQEPALGTAQSLWCLPDRPTVEPGGSAAVSARVVPPPARPLRFVWSAEAGRLSGEQAEDRSEAVWSALGVAPGAYTLSVEARDAETGTFLLCTVQIEVLPAARGLRDAGRSLLMEDEYEEPGFGLYSYLLIGVPPADDDRRRLYLATLGAYLDRITPLQALLELSEDEEDRARWNVTYLPVALPRERATAAEDLEELLSRYHFVRARHFLSTLSRLHEEAAGLDRGPYLVSSLDPLSSLDEVRSPILIQDLSGVPPALAAAWVAAFLSQTAQIRYWERASFSHLRLLLRTGIGIVAEGVPEIEEGLERWISWIE